MITVRKEINTVSNAILIASLVMTSIVVVGMSSSKADSLSPGPKTVWGYITYSNGSAVVDASVLLSASGYPSKMDTTDSSGAYQVDIGSYSGTEWPDGTSFTVTASKKGHQESNTGTVSGSVTRVDVIVYLSTLHCTIHGPYSGFVGESIQFTGLATGGTPPYTWLWDFGDGMTSTQQSPLHNYSKMGTYSVRLTVTDTGGGTDSIKTVAIILQENNTIDNPTINGPTDGVVDTIYTYNLFMDDEYNVPIRYFIDWGDGTIFVSDYVMTSEFFEISHQWDCFGVYTVTVFAFDKYNISTEPVTIMIHIDVIIIDDVINGWLIDSDNDGVFDVFKNLATAEETRVEKQDDSYLIDSTNDGNWDHTYSKSYGIQDYKEESPDDTPGLTLIMMLLGLFVCFLFWKKRNN